jgi:hypothetical protein
VSRPESEAANADTSLYPPLSLALTGFIWQLLYSRNQGLIN